MKVPSFLVEFPTTPVVNLLGSGGEFNVWSEEYLQFCRERSEVCRDMSLVELHKNRLGKQKCTWYGGEYRYWIWDGPGWRIFVSNKKGVCFEVPVDATFQQIWEAWSDYRKKILKDA